MRAADPLVVSVTFASVPPTRWMLITFSLGEVMRYSPAGMRTSSTVKANGILTVAAVFWAYAGTKLMRTSATAARVIVVVRFISCLRGAVAPYNDSDFAPEAENAQCTQGGL